ncbi:hypothetical protein VTH82DRAFT_3232 [Thermothelomyces myriococcoides]
MCSFHPPIGLQSPTLLQFLAEAAETFSGFPGFTNPWTRSDEDILLCSALNMMSDLDSARAWLAAQRSYETATGVQPQPSHYHDNSDENMIVDANQVHRYQTDTTAKNDGPLDICQEQDNLLQPNQTSRQQGQQGAQQEQEQVGTSAKKSSRAWTTEEIEALRENMNKHEWTYAKMSELDPRLRNRTAHAIESKVYALKGKRKALREARKAARGASKQKQQQRSNGGSTSCKPAAAEEHPRRHEPGDDGSDGEEEGIGDGSGTGSGLAGQLVA